MIISSYICIEYAYCTISICTYFHGKYIEFSKNYSYNFQVIIVLLFSYYQARG